MRGARCALSSSVRSHADVQVGGETAFGVVAHGVPFERWDRLTLCGDHLQPEPSAGERVGEVVDPHGDLTGLPAGHGCASDAETFRELALAEVRPTAGPGDVAASIDAVTVAGVRAAGCLPTAHRHLRGADKDRSRG
jgi:hypothetical protein